MAMTPRDNLFLTLMYHNWEASVSPWKAEFDF